MDFASFDFVLASFLGLVLYMVYVVRLMCLFAFYVDSLIRDFSDGGLPGQRSQDRPHAKLGGWLLLLGATYERVLELQVRSRVAAAGWQGAGGDRRRNLVSGGTSEVSAWAAPIFSYLLFGPDVMIICCASDCVPGSVSMLA